MLEILAFVGVAVAAYMLGRQSAHIEHLEDRLDELQDDGEAS